MKTATIMRFAILTTAIVVLTCAAAPARTTLLNARVLDVAGVDLTLHLCGELGSATDEVVELVALGPGVERSSLGVWRITGGDACSVTLSAVCNTRMPAPGQDVALVVHPTLAASSRPAAEPPEPSGEPSPPAQPTATRADEIALNIGILLNTTVPSERRMAAKVLYRHYRYEPEVQDAAEQALLTGYNQLVRDSQHVDAMAWLTNILGASGNPRFKPALDEVAKNTGAYKLHRYAAKNLRRLP